MNIELKPCPFCGGKAEMMGDQYPYVECQECGAGFTANHSYEFDEDDAASKWNARSTVGPNLKPIAESKVRQLGGDVCGVLVRKDGKLAAVDEHGRVQWLQSERGSEPVAWSWEYRGLHVSADKAFIEKIAADGFAVRPLVFADTQPARAQGGQPENPVAWVSRELVNGDCVGSMAYREKNGDDQAPVYSRAQGGQDLAMACAYCGGAEKVPAQQGSVPEEAVSLARKWLGITESSLLHNDDITKMAEALLATSQPAKQGVPEEEERLTDIYRRKLFECQDELNNLRSEYHNRTAELETEIEDLHEELQSMRHQPAVPEGWKLVPVEPTGQMLKHGTLVRTLGNGGSDKVYKAMIDAAPQPEGGEWVNLVEDLANRAESENISVEVVFDDGYTREGFDTDISEHVANWLRSIKRPQPPKEGSGNE